MNYERRILDTLAQHYFGYRADWTEAEAIEYIRKYITRVTV